MLRENTMSSDNILNISDFPVHKNNGIDLDILEDKPPKKGNTLRPSHSLLDPKCAAESLVGADESVEEPSICKVEETYDLYHGYDEADWQTKPQAPEKSLSKVSCSYYHNFTKKSISFCFVYGF